MVLRGRRERVFPAVVVAVEGHSQRAISAGNNTARGHVLTVNGERRNGERSQVVSTCGNVEDTARRINNLGLVNDAFFIANRRLAVGPDGNRHLGRR